MIRVAIIAGPPCVIAVIHTAMKSTRRTHHEYISCSDPANSNSLQDRGCSTYRHCGKHRPRQVSFTSAAGSAYDSYGQYDSAYGQYSYL